MTDDGWSGDGVSRDHGPRTRITILYQIFSSQQLDTLHKLQNISSSTLGVQIE